MQNQEQTMFYPMFMILDKKTVMGNGSKQYNSVYCVNTMEMQKKLDFEFSRYKKQLTADEASRNPDYFTMVKSIHANTYIPEVFKKDDFEKSLLGTYEITPYFNESEVSDKVIVLAFNVVFTEFQEEYSQEALWVKLGQISKSMGLNSGVAKFVMVDPYTSTPQVILASVLAHGEIWTCSTLTTKVDLTKQSPSGLCFDTVREARDAYFTSNLL